MPKKTTTAARQAVRLSAITYTDARGKTFTGKVIAAGSTSGVKLLLAGGGTSATKPRVIDNVQPATSMKGANNVGKYTYR